MLELIAALWMQEVDGSNPELADISVGLEAECLWTGEINDRAVRGLDLLCPEEEPAYVRLNQRAEWVLSHLPSDIYLGAVALQIDPVFIWTGQDWDLLEPHRLVYRSSPYQYDRPFTDRMRTSLCYGRVFFDGDGEVDDQDWECVHFRRNNEPRFRNLGMHRMARKEHENDRFIMPQRLSSHCTEERYHMTVDGVLQTYELEAVFPEDQKPRCPTQETETD